MSTNNIARVPLLLKPKNTRKPTRPNVIPRIKPSIRPKKTDQVDNTLSIPSRKNLPIDNTIETSPISPKNQTLELPSSSLSRPTKRIPIQTHKPSSFFSHSTPVKENNSLPQTPVNLISTNTIEDETLTSPDSIGSPQPKQRKKRTNASSSSKALVKVAKKSFDITKRTMKDIAMSVPKGEKVKKRIIQPAPPRPNIMTEAENYENQENTTPQVQIIDGQIVINQSSLELNLEKESKDEHYEEIFESGFHNGGYSYLKRPKPTKWKSEETKLFYQCLRQVGTDFSMMITLIENRCRRELKNKFKMEEKHRPELIKIALENKLEIDDETLVTMLESIVD